jgi:hypothetical protein
MPVYDTLKAAVLTQKPCIIAKPHEPQRKICPYRIGRSDDGIMNVLYYQFEGYTSRPSGLKPDGDSANWRCNHVADIEFAEITQGNWHEPLQKPKKRGPCIADLCDAEVKNYY